MGGIGGMGGISGSGDSGDSGGSGYNMLCLLDSSWYSYIEIVHMIPLCYTKVLSYTATLMDG